MRQRPRPRLAGAGGAHERSEHPRAEGACDALEQQQLAGVGALFLAGDALHALRGEGRVGAGADGRDGARRAGPATAGLPAGLPGAAALLHRECN